jgi:tripartite-type tricarboxylate transporter receptor subunit TctC
VFKTIITAVRPFVVAAALLGHIFLYCDVVLAQDIYPNKPIKIVLGVAAGASTDFLAREVGRGLSERLKVPVVIENKAGANTIIGTNAVAKSAPDGYTLYLTTITTAINPFIYNNLPFDFKKDMRNIVLLGVADNVFAVTPKIGMNNAQDMLAYAKKNPGQFTYGSSGIGTIHNLLMELIADRAQVQVNHIPYKGAMAAVTDVLGGNLIGYFGTISAQREFIKRGDLTPLFVTSAKRSIYLPEVPTLAEAGLPPIATGYWMGLSAPANTSDAVVNRLNKEINEILLTPEVIQKFNQQAIDPLGGSPKEMDVFFDEELKLWQAAAVAAKIVPISLGK